MTHNLPQGFEISEEYPTHQAVYYLSYNGDGVGAYYTLKAAEDAAAVGERMVGQLKKAAEDAATVEAGE